MPPKLRKQIWLRNRQRLDALFERYDSLPESDGELCSHWVKYLVVITSGLIESTLSSVFIEYSTVKASPKVSRFVAARLEKPGNMSSKKIQELVAEFDADWVEEMHQLEDFERISASVDSIVSNRNRVAHGEDVGLTIRQLTGFWIDVKTLLDFIERCCDDDCLTANTTARRRR